MDADKVLASISGPLLAAPLTRDQQHLLALQLLAWARLSDDGLLDPKHQIQSVKGGTNSDIIDAAKAIDEQNKAFRGLAPSVVTAGATAIRQVFDECDKLREQGHLHDFDPRDVIAKVAAPGEFSVSPDLADLMVGLLGLTADQTAYCAWDTTGQFVGRLLPRTELVFSEALAAMPSVALMAIFSKGRLEEEATDPLRDPKAVEDRTLRQFDVAIGLPPIGEKLDPTIVDRDLYHRFTHPKASRTVLAIQHLMAHARQRVVVAVPNSLLFNTSADADFRAELLRNGQIQAVITLPPGLLKGSALPLSLLVLSKPGGHRTTRFINADADYFRTSQSRKRVEMEHLDELVAFATSPADGWSSAPPDLVIDVPVEQVLDNSAQLQASRYLVPKEQQTIGFLLQDKPVRALGELVEVLRPTLIKRKEGNQDKALLVREVGTGDLPSRGSMAAPAKEIDVPVELIEKSRLQFLAHRDIVVMIKGNVGKVGFVPDAAPPSGPGAWILGQSTIALRVRSETGVDPCALFMLLRSPLGQRLMAGIVSNATIQLISLRELLQLEVPLPSPAEAASCADILAKEDRLQHQIDELSAQQAALAKSLWSIDVQGVSA